MATPRQQLADALRQARVDIGYPSQRDLARRLHVSRPLISRAENAAEAVPSPALIVQWAEATGADVDALNDLAKRARSPRSLFVRWSTDFEQRATLIRWFELNLIPGLLQTENYARSLVSWKPFRDEADATLSDRLARQSILDHVELRVLILGSVLHREVGSASVMAEQIEHLLAMGERPSVTIQVVPDTPDVAGALGGAFAIASQNTSDIAAYSGSLVAGSVHTETDLIERAARVWDGLHASALPWNQTREFLTEAGGRYGSNQVGQGVA